jgi:hypothetical protein
MTDTAEVVVRTFSTHNPSGDTLYGADIAVETDSRKRMGSVRPLYDRRPDLYELRAALPVRIIRAE